MITMRNSSLEQKGKKLYLPPYGKILVEKLQRGEQPHNNIFMGAYAWQKANAHQTRQWVLALPLGESPYRYCWPIQNLEILAFDTGGLTPTLIEQTAHALLLAKAKSVHVLTNHQCVIYRDNKLCPKSS